MSNIQEVLAKAKNQAKGPKEINLANLAAEDEKQTEQTKPSYDDDEDAPTTFKTKAVLSKKDHAKTKKHEPSKVENTWGEVEANFSAEPAPKPDTKSKKAGTGVLAAAQGKRGPANAIAQTPADLNEEYFPSIGEEVKPRPKKEVAEPTSEKKPEWREERKTKEEKEGDTFGERPHFKSKAGDGKPAIQISRRTEEAPAPAPVKEEEAPAKPNFLNSKLKEKPANDKPLEQAPPPTKIEETKKPEPVVDEWATSSPVKFVNKKGGGVKELQRTKQEELESRVEKELEEKNAIDKKEFEERKKARDEREIRKKAQEEKGEAAGDSEKKQPRQPREHKGEGAPTAEGEERPPKFVNNGAKKETGERPPKKIESGEKKKPAEEAAPTKAPKKEEEAPKPVAPKENEFKKTYHGQASTQGWD